MTDTCGPEPSAKGALTVEATQVTCTQIDGELTRDALRTALRHNYAGTRLDNTFYA